MKKIVGGGTLLLIFVSGILKAESWKGIDLEPPSLCREASNIELYTTKRLKGSKRLSQGIDQWYFRSEIDFMTDFDFNSSIYSELKRLSESFKSHGVKLVLVYPPSRGLVSSRKLDTNDPLAVNFEQSKAELSYKKRISTLNALGIASPDFSNLHNWNNDSFPLFQRQDFHWTAQGAYQTAKLTVDKVKLLPEFSSIEHVPYETHQAGVRPQTKGAMKRAISDICDIELPDEYMKVMSTSKKNDEDSEENLLFSESAISIILLGTSFSFFDHFNFSGALQDHFDADVLNLSVSGGNYSGSLDQYLHDLYLTEEKPKIVIWESLLHHIPKQKSFFRRMIPAVNGGCSEEQEVLTNTVNMTQSVNSVLVNTEVRQNILRGSEYFLKMQFDNTSVNKFDIRVWYDNGKSEKVSIERSDRVENNGLYYLELSNDKAFQDLSFVAADISVQDLSQSVGMVSTALCQRADTHKAHDELAKK